MDLIVTLFLVGVVLIAVEVFVPGGIIGVFGVLALIAGVVFAYLDFGAQGALIGSLAAALLVALALIIEFVALPKTSLGQKLFLRRSLSGASQYTHSEDLEADAEGVAVTALAPTGMVMIDGKKYEAASRSGFIEKNESVKVVAKDNFRLIVSKL